MSTLITRFAPQAIVLAVALYWSWPAVKASLPQTTLAVPKVEAKKSAGADFSVAVLSPAFLPPSNRNPFLAPVPKTTTVAGGAKTGKKSIAAKAAPNLRDSGLVLSATCIVGRQRMAIINGRVYKEKEAIQRPGDETASCIVTEILPHKVLLSCQGETLQLSYLNVGTKSGAGDDPRKPAK
jgi:hypothetical protein